MPQMMPMNWTMLFIFFLITFMVFNTINYFSYLPMTKEQQKLNKKSKDKMNWKW
uniref:ATP synthase complex subunit 8 n=1 Tax=Tryonicus parvus TaxID=1554535 RepID=A0A2P1H9R0_9NEOP|nr:ATP synthase F0 subunit 8 [Tryonicus parvus]